MRQASSFAPRVALPLAVAAVLASGPCGAALTDISPIPLASSNSAQVKPNIMLLMDTSGSMGRTHMPDDVENFTNGRWGFQTIGYKSYQCNALYYNPNTTYALPRQSNGTFFPTPTFSAARYDAFDTSSNTVVDLSSAFGAYDPKTLLHGGYTDAAQPAYYYLHTGGSGGSGALGYGQPPCNDADNGVPGTAGPVAASDGGTWTRVLVSSSSGIGNTDERVNFAVWYAYYRTRILTMKTAASLAFTPLTDSFRVGFITVNPKYPNNLPVANDSLNLAINPAKYLPIADFDQTQRSAWFAKLFSQKPGGSSPTREGLARVGRHYAGMHDGINTGMPEDPVQYSCQQNFTIMTTDGYWNAQNETPGAGPVQIDGTTPVGQQDGTLTPPSGLSPRPIWDGIPDGALVTTDKENAFAYAPCGTYFSTYTTQINRSTSQVVQSTQQTLQSTTQILQSTNQNLATTSQMLQSSTQPTQTTTQVLQSTNQNLQNTTQNLQNTSQLTLSTLQTRVATTQNTVSTLQNTQTTTTISMVTTQNLEMKQIALKSTTQNLQSTSQNLQSTSQTTQSTSQIVTSTSQLTIQTAQTTQSTAQTFSCDTNGENCAPVPSGTCVAGGGITCQVITTGPSLVASCTPQTANVANAWESITCNTTSSTPVGTASCTNQAANAGNNYTQTICNTVVTGPTPTPTCNPALASAGNNWTATTCNTLTTGPTAVATCAPGAAEPGNNYTATTCGSNTTTNVPVQTCTASAASSGNGWTTTNCSTNNTPNTPVASCTSSSATSANRWVTTTCSTNNTTNVAVASCSASVPTAGNAWTTTTCPAPTIVEPWTPVQTCTAVAPTAGNGYTQTLCSSSSNTQTTNSCTPQAPNAGNNWTSITCNPVNVTVPVLSCTAQTGNAGNNWITITCGSNTTGPTPILACVPAAPTAANSWTQVTCGTNTTGPTPASSCTPVAVSAGNNWTATTCPNVATGPTGVQTCTNDPASAGNNWTATTCNTVTNNNVPVATCTAAVASAGNNWTDITCPAPIVTTNVPVANCVAAGPSAANNYTSVSCLAPVTTTNVPVQTCIVAAANAGNNYVSTSCQTVTTGPTGVQTCTPIAASSGNNWTATTCGSNNSAPTPVQTCTPQTAGAGNGWIDIVCTANNQVNVPVMSCTASGPTAANGWTTTTCPAPITTTNVPVVSCSAQSAVPGNNYTSTTCSSNNTTNVAVQTCTAQTGNAGNAWTTITCSSNNTSKVGVQTCTPSSASAGNNWTDTTCPGPITTGPTPVASCVPSAATAANGWTAASCVTNTSPSSIVSSCNPATANAGNNYTATICNPLPGKKIQYVMTTTVSTTPTSGGSPTGPTTTTTTTGPVTDLNGVCYAPGSEPALPSPNPQAAGMTAGPTAPAPCAGWPCTQSTVAANARSVNSLADVAQYYYVTDLRPGMVNDVPAVGAGPEDDRVRWQHMTTFSIALGVNGTLQYRPDYKNGSVIVGDFADIRTGVKNWPLWPDPSLDYVNNPGLYENPKSNDDFWHAAVNGRGTYFSATNPTSVINGLASALAGIQARLASGSAAGTSSLQPVPGDNFVYVASYTTSKWSGDIQAHQLDTVRGDVSSTVDWSAQTLLDAKTGNACDNRKIYLLNPGAVNNLVNFSWNTFPCDASGQPTGSADTGLNSAEKNNFGSLNVSLMSQYPQMTDGSSGTADQRSAAAGANLVNFLRGQRGLENFTVNDASKLYRQRDHVLGDIVDGQPVYVKAPFATYQDAGYAAFKTAYANRPPMVYAPANDGMLHAFYAGTSPVDPLRGQEAWALIPTAVLPNLWKLADANYSNIHQWFVDGTPTVGDAYDATNTAWKTVLVAGLSGGGKSYYAVDVTDPTSPKALWEFKWRATCYDPANSSTWGADCHLGYTYGKPAITKLADGTWVVLVTSGYNNVSSPSIAGDGGSYLYVLDAFSGQIRYKIATNVGNASTPSGLAQINNFIDNSAVSNTTRMVYGGDLLGNIWRFDVNDSIAPAGREATLIGVATDSGGTPQPITTRPELAEVNAKPMVFVATGKLLGATDISDTQPQTIYGIVDPLTGSPAYADLRTALVPLALTQTGSGASAVRTVACTGNAAECGSTNGWRVDLPDPGERVNVDMRLALGTLVVPSNVPQSIACATGGYSWLNYLSYTTGQAVSSSGSSTVSQYATPAGQALTVGVTIVQLPDGTLRAILVTSDAAIRSLNVPYDTPAPVGKRISWREIAN